MTDKVLISNIYKQLTQLNTEKKTQFKNQQQHMNKHFSKEEMQMVNRHVKRSSTLLTIREMQVKTTKRHHFTPVRGLSLKNTNIGKDVKKRTLAHRW